MESSLPSSHDDFLWAANLQIGGTRSVGIELFSDQVDQRSSHDVGKQARQSINQLLL